ncbi:TraR/DksA C4-type zinc finger protein [bacterium]|nr:TraR/DksA C4-type zinc finger protein [bacterium]
MNKKELKKFQELLESKRQEILDLTDDTKEDGLGCQPEDLPDDIDLASSETSHYMNLRLRDRELTLLKKIDKTLEKIVEGTFGVCEECGDPIEKKRLEARPIADLCIRCKEEQERVEKGFVE